MRVHMLVYLLNIFGRSTVSRLPSENSGMTSDSDMWTPLKVKVATSLTRTFYQIDNNQFVFSPPSRLITVEL